MLFSIFFGLGFLDWVSPNRSSIDRGVTSFAAEPTFFAIILFFISWLIFNSISKIDNNQKQNFKYKISLVTLFLNLFTICFIAKSATVILMMLIIGTFRLLFLLKKCYLLSYIFDFIHVTFLYINYKPNFLFEKGLSESRPVLLLDAINKFEFKNFYLLFIKMKVLMEELHKYYSIFME